MMSRNLYVSIVLFVLLLLATCFASAYGYFKLESVPIAIVGLLFVLIETLLLIHYLNTTNRRLAYFIDSIKNDDTSVKFPKDIKNKAVIDLYNNLNIINDIIRDTKIEIAYNEKLLQTMIEYSSSGFIMIDEKGDFEMMNNAARKYLNVEYTSNLKRLNQHDPQLYQIFSNIKPGETKIHKAQLNGQNNVLSISVAEIKYYSKKFRIISLKDISKELEEQELESWHKLFRVITHEIMNSIAPITSLSQTLIRFFSKNGEHKSPVDINDKIIIDTLSGLQVIDDMSNGLMSFVKNYRQLSKIPMPKVERIEIKPWLLNLKTLMLEMTKDFDINLKITVSDNCKEIFSDEKLLNQVILNLVKNSIEALEEIQSGEIIIHVYKDERSRTVLSVRDNGEGISEEDMDKIFVPFFTTKEQGNGIGLSLSKQIMRKLSGSLAIQSIKGKGTEVRLTI